jgi:multidrug efflux pump subunit AcrA (membrane-fusion protein)
LCNELATRAGATRVSLGWLKGNRVKVKALSHTEDFDKKQELIVLLEKVMEECIDQEQVVQYVPNGQSSDNVTRAAAALSRTQGGHSVISIPLRHRTDIIGVVTLEFLHGQEISPNMGRGLAVAVDLLAPQLFDRHTNDRWLATKAAISTREMTKMLLGRQHTLAKVIAAAVVGVVAFVVFFQPMYHVSPPFEFAAIANNAVSAPFEGSIKQIATREDERDGVKILRPIKPGDHVEKGELLVVLDTTDAIINRAKALGDMESKAHERDAKRAYAIANNDDQAAAQAEMAEAERKRAEAEMKYYEHQIEKAQVIAPISGTILKGDLEDKLQAPVKQGDLLMEIGNPENLRAELLVEDRDMYDIHVGQTGMLATHALPDDKHKFTVDRIIPVGQAKEGSNVFTVYAHIDDKGSEAWRPGMAGEARVNVEHRRLIWIWTHRLVDFLKLKLWM